MVWAWLGSGGEGQVVDESRGRRVAASGAVDGLLKLYYGVREGCVRK